MWVHQSFVKSINNFMPYFSTNKLFKDTAEVATLWIVSSSKKTNSQNNGDFSLLFVAVVGSIKKDDA